MPRIMVTVLVSLALIETIGRFLLPDYLPYSDTGILRPSSAQPYPLHEWTPGARGKFRDGVVHINSHGFIGREVSIERPPNTRRVAVLGDSIAAGWGLSHYQDNFSSILEASLSVEDRRTEVLNLAVPGYDAYESVQRFLDLGVAFEPDVVVYALCYNDLSLARPPAYTMERLIYTSHSILWRSAIWRTLIARRVQRNAPEDPRYEDLIGEDFLTIENGSEQKRLAVALERTRTGRFSDYGHHTLMPLPSLKATGHFELALSRLRSAATRQGFRVVIALIPLDTPLILEGAEETYEAFTKLIVSIAAKYQIETIDVDGPLREAGFENVIVDDSDWHPNALGHRIIAEALAPRLEALLSVPRHLAPR